MAKPKNVEELMGGLGRVHKSIASRVPTAYKISPEFREATKRASIDEILNAYNESGLFPKTSKGEPIRANLQSYSSNPDKRRLSTDGKIEFRPESEQPGSGKQPIARIGFYADDPSLYSTTTNPLTAEFLRRSGPGSRVVGVDATQAGREGLGQPAYQLMYDLIRASGDVNLATSLTEINQIRRLHNAMSHAMGRGGFGGIMPVMERETLRSQRANTPSVSFSPQLFGNPLNLTGRYVDAEKAALEGLLPNREIAGQATLLNPSDLAKMSDEELLGLLSLREAQMAAAYGPARRDLLSPVDKPRAETMARMHQSPYRAAPGRISVEPQAAIGANTMLRQVTTEEAAKRLLLGQDPFEIAEDIVKMTERPLEVFKGRYAQGGLAHAAS